MRYIELSIEDVRDRSKRLAEIISADFKPDVVVFIAKGSYLIGYEMSKIYKVPLVEIFAERKGNKIKHFVSPILKYIPRDLKNYLRKKELDSGFHSKSVARNVHLTKGRNTLEQSNHILIVDDSVDSGFTVKEVFQYLKTHLNNENIKVAAFNYFDESSEIFQIDYYLYRNAIIQGPWSKDSKYYKVFQSKYEIAKKRGDI